MRQVRPLDLRRYPDGLQRQRWRLTLWHALAGAVLGAGLCSAGLWFVPPAQVWQDRLAALQARRQAHADAQESRQRERLQAEQLRQRQARWQQWEREREQLARLWSVLEGASDLELTGLELEGGHLRLHIRLPDEPALDRLLATLARARLGAWRVQQQSVAVQGAGVPGPAATASVTTGQAQVAVASGWQFVLQAPWPAETASSPVLASRAGPQVRQPTEPVPGSPGEPR